MVHTITEEDENVDYEEEVEIGYKSFDEGIEEEDSEEEKELSQVATGKEI